MRTIPRAVLCVAALTAMVVMFDAPALFAYWIDNGVPIANGAIAYQAPAQVGDGSGGALIAWVDSTADSSGYVLRVNRIYSNGNLPGYWDLNGNPVPGTTPLAQTPAICEDDSSGVFVFWLDGRAGAQEIYGTRLNADGAIAAGWPAGGLLVSSGPGLMSVARAKADGFSGALVAWTETDSGTSNQHVFVQRLSSSGAALWQQGGVSFSTNTSDNSPVLAPDDSGGAWVAWVHQDGNQPLAWGRVSAAGSPDYRGTLAGTDGAVPNGLIRDGNGGAYLVYTETPGSSGDIGATRIGSDGSVLWSIAVCSATGSQRNARISGDAFGNLLATWEDRRGGTDWDVYAQRVDPAGNPTWTANGVALCTHASDQLAPKIVPAIAGAAIVVWQDGRSTDLYAQRVDSTGTPRWTADGEALTTTGAAGPPSSLIIDGSGGALVSWQDLRNDNPGIYENKVDSLGRSGSSPVLVSGIAATAAQGGSVDLRWTTFTPAGTLFEVLRSASAAGPFTPVSPGIASRSSGQELEWRDATTLPGRSYFYKLSWQLQGAWAYSGLVTVLTGPPRFELHALTANPSAGPVGLTFEVAAAGRTRIDILDVSGRLVATPLDATLPVGSGRVDWDGRDAAGWRAAAGIYFARMTQGARRTSIRLVRVR